MNKDNLLIVISTSEKESILKFPLLYGSVALPREYWKRVHIMFWGASIKTLSQDRDLQEKVLEVAQSGVEFSSCIVCCQEYGVVAELENLNIDVEHTGVLLTEALKSDSWATLTI